jgi:2-polyprenyl-6-methoxyphenol hydroxylase-like FAD-dependent oxidoreductase
LNEEFPVLICGGGPAGLVLSIELSNRGIRHLLVNDRPAPAKLPKLDIANTRTMEILRRLGVVDEVRAAGAPADSPTLVTFKVRHFEEAVVRLGPDTSPLTPYASVDEFKRRSHEVNDGTLPLEANLRISQMYLEPALKAKAESSPVADIRFGWALTAFSEDHTGVSAQIKHIGTEESATVRANFLAGCDGAPSLVRTELGIKLEGDPGEGEVRSFFFRSREFAEMDPLGIAWHAWSLVPGIPAAIVSVNADDLFVCHCFGPVEDADQTLFGQVGRPFAYELLNTSRWKPTLLAAESYGTDRVFLSGDAAHQYIPVYGLGYNTAVIDATNLAWKLAAVEQGWGGPQLLKSYEQEQRPLGIARRDLVGAGMLQLASWQRAVRPEVLQASPEGEAHRAELAELIPGLHRRFYESLGLELGYRYAGSSVGWPDDSPEPDFPLIDYLPTTWPGARLPHVFLADGSAMFDRLGSGFTLLLMEDVDHKLLAAFRAAAETRRVPLEILQVDEPWIRDLYERAFILVRPDQHVAWRGNSLPQDPLAVVDRVRGA